MYYILCCYLTPNMFFYKFAYTKEFTISLVPTVCIYPSLTYFNAYITL